MLGPTMPMNREVSVKPQTKTTVIRDNDGNPEKSDV
jgi:hypothetical protein